MIRKRDNFLPVAEPVIGDDEINSVIRVLKSGWLATGREVNLFEENVKDYLGCKYAIGLTSCTAGLHLALSALGIKEGDEVIVPVYTYVATAHVVEWLGATPVFVDVEKDTFNINPKKIEEKITSKTKAIIPVHFAGHSCDIDAILNIGAKYKIPIIEDAAHAIGTEFKGRKIGNFGKATVFSFYATKNITTAEGGMIVTNDESYAKKLKSLSYFGIDKDAFGRYSEGGSWYYEVVDKGFKYNMNNIQGALGIEQLKKLDGFTKKRRKLAELYHSLLKDVEGISTPHEKDYTCHVYHLYPIIIDQNLVGMKRSQLIERLREYNIGASVHFIPLHLHPYYKNQFGYKKGDFPVAEALFEAEISLPLYPGMEEVDAVYVVDAIKEVLNEKNQ